MKLKKNKTSISNGVKNARSRVSHKYLTSIKTAIAAAALFSLACVPQAMAAPQYDSEKTKKLVAQWVDAHGGTEKWMAAPSMSFTLSMYLASLPVGGETKRSYFDNWRYYSVTVEPATSRAYVDVPMESIRGPEAGFDGTSVWAQNYTFESNPNFRDGPFQLLWCHYGMISLPFISQMDGVTLTALPSERLEQFDKTFQVVRMSYENVDKEGVYDVFIDPDTHLMRAWRHTAFFPLLPGGVKVKAMFGDGSSPGVLRLVDEYMVVDGLTIPRSYTSIGPDGKKVTGAHLVVDASFSKPFDAARAAIPKGVTRVKKLN